MNFSDALQEMYIATAEVFGETIRVTPVRGTAFDVQRAIWATEKPTVVITDARQVETRDDVVTVLAADWAAPARGATVTRTATGELWTVVDVTPLRGGAWKLSLTRAAAVARARSVGEAQ
ncbi:MAG: hypothetical protein BWX86_00536 [Verrucomicrobia bacterium ADurb.Bin122]|nr:MAG: hypothetical protein BWX86_00536 [Verrucomicrobia bacterium ADurb.Bin122]